MCTTTKNREINYYKSIEDFIPYFYSKTIKGKLPNIMSHEELLTWYHTDPDAKLWLDKEFEIAKEQFSVSQSNKGVKGGARRVENSTEEELSETAVKAGTASMAKRKENGTISKFCSDAGKSAWEDRDKMMAVVKVTQPKATEAGSKQSYCKCCGNSASVANVTRYHKLNKDGKCKTQIIYEILPEKFTKKEAQNICKKNGLVYHTHSSVNGSDNRIKVLYQPEVANQHNPTIYCKEEVYEDLAKQYEDFKTPKQLVLEHFEIGEEFTIIDLKKICEKYNFKGIKKFKKDYCFRTYLGGKINPTRYKIIAK